MPRRSSRQPTEAQLEILAVLWERGSSTVREVHEALQADRETILTTTLKLIQIMEEKGLVKRAGKSRPQHYRPAVPQRKAQAGLLDDLAQRAFDGSVQKLLVRAVEDSGLSVDELKEIQVLIDGVRKQRRGNG